MEAFSQYEELSLRQCLHVLHNRHIILITYPEFDKSNYDYLLSEYSNVTHDYSFFDKRYFKSISGYNELLLSRMFYDRFRSYSHILIYQLDAYIFRDELDYWCSLSYDYIGAPWFEGFRKTTNNRLWKVGNGGLSLRRVSSFIKLFEWLFKAHYLSNYQKLRPIGKVIRLTFLFANLLLSRFRSKKCNSFKNLLNEDVFWCTELAFRLSTLIDSRSILYKLFLRQQPGLIIPEVELAIPFSFDHNAKLMFEKNNFTLPMGCHAWHKEYDEFWIDHISLEGIKNVK